MKNAITTAVAACTLVLTALFTGCEPNEALLVSAANTAGNLGLSAWFAIDDPDAEVKQALTEVVTLVRDGAASVGDGGTYIDALTPAIQKFVSDNDKLNPSQKNLINTGASVILSGLDTFVDSNPELKGNAALVSKVVAAFCKGCLTAIERSEDCCSEKSLKRAHQVIRMKYEVSTKAFVE